jgi:tagatose-1,6-bisphosphate aldolase non-catalytic subunit AgaZ/GatZ
MAKLESPAIPDPLVSQFLPRCYEAVRERAIAPRPLPLVLEAIRQAFLLYLKATGADLSQSTRGEMTE